MHLKDASVRIVLLFLVFLLVAPAQVKWRWILKTIFFSDKSVALRRATILHRFNFATVPDMYFPHAYRSTLQGSIAFNENCITA